MRTQSRRSTFRLLCFSLLIFATPASGQSPSPEATSAVGKVSALFGPGELKATAKVSTAASPSVRYLHKDGEVFMRDLLETSPEQTAKVLLRDDTELVLAPSTRCVVETFIKSKGESYGDEFRTVLNLVYGTLGAMVRHAYAGNQAFVVKTGNGIMGVRGTQFVISYDASRVATELHVLKGTVAFGNVTLGTGIVRSSAATLVQAGMLSSIVGKAGQAAKPSAFDTQIYRQRLKSKAGDFDRAIYERGSDSKTGGSDKSGAQNNANGPRSLSDALKSARSGDDRGIDARNLRGAGPGGGHGRDGGPGMGRASDSGNTPGGNMGGGLTPGSLTLDDLPGLGGKMPPPGGALPPPPGGGLPPPPPPGGSLPPPPPPGGGGAPPPPPPPPPGHH